MTQILIQGVDGDIKANFKAACAKRNTTMKEEFIAFMQTYIKKYDTYKVQRAQRLNRKRSASVSTSTRSR